MSRWKYQFSYDHWSQAFLAQPVFKWVKVFWGLLSAGVEQFRRKANIVAWGDGKFGPWGWPYHSFRASKSVDRHFSSYIKSRDFEALQLSKGKSGLLSLETRREFFAILEPQNRFYTTGRKQFLFGPCYINPWSCQALGIIGLMHSFSKVFYIVQIWNKDK